MYKILIVEDNENNRNTIKKYLKEYFREYIIAGEAESVAGAIKILKSQRINIALLDIELTDGTSFDILEKIETPEFLSIFITSFDNFAIKAFKYAAVDYLLKPLDEREFVQAMNKAVSVIQRKNFNEMLRTQIDILKQSLNNQEIKNKKIVLPSQKELRIVNISEIIMCKADSNYCHFYLKSGEKIIVSRPMKEFSDILSDHSFKRLHKSFLINPDFIKSYVKENGGYLLMENDLIASVSRRNRDQISDLIQDL